MRGLYAETHTHIAVIWFVLLTLRSSNVALAIPAHLPIRNSRKFYLTCNMAGRFTALYMNLKGRIPETRISFLEFGNNKMLRRIVIQWAKDLGKPR